MYIQGRHHVNFFGGGGGFVKSWTSHPGKYSELGEGATKTKYLKVGNLIM